MAFEYPTELKYFDTHEYVRLDGETATVGITAFAVDQLGDIVFLELPEVGDRVEQGEKFGTVESVKAVEDLNAPVTGLILEVNAPLMDTPEQLGEDPYGEAWLIKVQVDDLAALGNALSASEYRSRVEGH